MTGRKRSRISRRRVLTLLGVGGGATLMAACAPAAPASPTAKPGAAPPAAAPTTAAAKPTVAPPAAGATKKYQGLTLRGLSQAGIAYEPALKAFAKEFEEQTGAKVELEFTPWETLMPKIQADIASGQPQYDVFVNNVDFQYTIHPHLLPLGEMIKKSAYSLDGFFAPSLKYSDGIGGNSGVLFGLPIRVGVSPVFYRTDLIPQLPTTWAGYEEALAKHTASGKYGLGFAGVPAQLVKLFLARYWSQGEPLFTPDWEPKINGEKGVKALTMLKDHMSKYGAPGMLSWGNLEASNAFLNGDVAVLEGWATYVAPKLQDPGSSKVVDKWAIAAYPENGTGNFAQHAAVVFKTTKSPDAAFELIAAATNPAAAKRLLLEFKEESARKSAWLDPGVIAQLPYLPDYAAVMEKGKPFAFNVPQWFEMFTVLGEGASTALSGKATPQEALNQVAEKWTQSLKQAPLSFKYQE